MVKNHVSAPLAAAKGGLGSFRTREPEGRQGTGVSRPERIRREFSRMQQLTYPNLVMGHHSGSVECHRQI